MKIPGGQRRSSREKSVSKRAPLSLLEKKETSFQNKKKQADKRRTSQFVPSEGSKSIRGTHAGKGQPAVDLHQITEKGGRKKIKR